MSSPLCVNCRVPFKKVESGVSVLEMTGQEPYQLIRADLFQCPGCQTRVVASFAKIPEMEHYQEGFAATLAVREAEGVVFRSYEKVRDVVEALLARD